MYRFNSHVQLQYLISRCGLSSEALQEEMNKYYTQPCWELHLTKYAKVTGVKLKPLHPRPPIAAKVVRKMNNKFKPRVSKPVVTIKRRRIFK